jgi:aspartokinase/homoserine dehydrogenase 1
LVGVATSDRVAFSPQGLDPERWREAARPGAGVDIETLDRLSRLPVPVLVDCTAAEGMETLYEAALTRGVHVVVANKKAFTTPMATRDRLLETARRSHRAFRYEATVGAALPVINTLHDLVRTGDAVRRIEGALSGSLGFICERLNQGVPLDVAVEEARERGYTEPCPQEDLAGTDAARKALILARELGLRLELSDVAITPLVPETLLRIEDPAAFVAALRQHRDLLSARTRDLCAGGRVLRYLAVIDPAAEPALRVGPVAVESTHPAASLAGNQAFVAFTTRRYAEYPLIVQGAGAGGEITASGVLAEALRIAKGVAGGVSESLPRARRAPLDPKRHRAA